MCEQQLFISEYLLAAFVPGYGDLTPYDICIALLRIFIKKNLLNTRWIY